MDSIMYATLTILFCLLHASSGDQSNNPLCKDITNLDCSDDVKREICASDGITYGTSCDFAKARCADDTISIVSEGPCAKVPQPDPICSTLITTLCPALSNQVCASNLVTYNNFCEFEKSKCSSPGMTLLSLGWCPSPTTPTTTTTQSIQDLICESLENASCPIGEPVVCGSDGITYNSGCDLEKASCNSATGITLVSTGAC